LICMELRRRANPDRIDFGVGDNLHCIRCVLRHTESLGSCDERGCAKVAKICESGIT
jgi:hypothetical protein